MLQAFEKACGKTVSHPPACTTAPASPCACVTSGQHTPAVQARVEHASHAPACMRAHPRVCGHLQLAYKLADRRPGDVAVVYGDASLALKELGAPHPLRLPRRNPDAVCGCLVCTLQAGRRSWGSPTCAKTRGGGSPTSPTVTTSRARPCGMPSGLRQKLSTVVLAVGPSSDRAAGLALTTQHVAVYTPFHL